MEVLKYVYPLLLEREALGFNGYTFENNSIIFGRQYKGV